MKQPEALELADLFDRGGTNNALHRAAADELRRLHKTNQNSIAALEKANEQTEHFERLWYLRGDLIEELVEALEYHQEQTRPIQKTIDVLAKARGEA